MEDAPYYHVDLFNPHNFLCHSIFNDTPIKTEDYIPDDDHNVNISPDDAYGEVKHSMESEREGTHRSRHSVGVIFLLLLFVLCLELLGRISRIKTSKATKMQNLW